MPDSHRLSETIAGSTQTDANNMSEAEAIRLSCAGDSNAFEFLYRVHSRRVYRLCLRMVKNPATAEDLTQEAFLQLFRKIHTFRGESSFSSWLYRLTFNVVLMKLRKKRHTEISIDEPADPSGEYSKPLRELGGPDRRISGMLDHVNLGKAIDQLADGYREVFILHDVEGYEHREIAKILGFSIGNSKSQLFKARLRLRSLLRETLRSRAREERECLKNPFPEFSHVESL
jgi:RNA polymerase sigma-70 factor, ECF subfamily